MTKHDKVLIETRDSQAFILSGVRSGPAGLTGHTAGREVVIKSENMSFMLIDPSEQDIRDYENGDLFADQPEVPGGER